jgi:flagellar basal-body rod modification protein FlgD
VDSGRSQQALNTEEFMQLLITELTNQDPFEPMKNQDLLNQIASIQQLESNQTMNTSFENMVGRFDNIADKFENLSQREQLSAAGRLIGQLISGTDVNGQQAFGQVTSVTIAGDDVLLELDTGQTVNMNHMSQLGGEVESVKGSDMIGKSVIAVTAAGESVFGTVRSLEVDGQSVMLHVKPNNNNSTDLIDVPLAGARVLDESTVDLMVGLTVAGNNGAALQGVVTGYKIDGDGLKLVIDNDPVNGLLRLSQITGIVDEAI